MHAQKKGAQYLRRLSSSSQPGYHEGRYFVGETGQDPRQAISALAHDVRYQLTFEVTTSYVESAEPEGGSVQSLFQSEVGIKPSSMTLQEANEQGFEEPKTARYRRSGYLVNDGGDYRLYRGADEQDGVVQQITAGSLGCRCCRGR